jgi:hypothetical protein
MWRVLKGFKRNQGLLLSGGVAYNSLLSIIPMLALILIGLSQFIEQDKLLEIIIRELELIVPGHAEKIADEVVAFLQYRQFVGIIGIGVMLFFSSMANGGRDCDRNGHCRCAGLDRRRNPDHFRQKLWSRKGLRDWALPGGNRRLDINAGIIVSCYAGRTDHHPSRTSGRYHRRHPVGDHPARAGLVFCETLPGQRHIRFL